MKIGGTCNCHITDLEFLQLTALFAEKACMERNEQYDPARFKIFYDSKWDTLRWEYRFIAENEYNPQNNK